MSVTLPSGPLVSPSWLVRHFADVAVADVRWYLDGRSARAAYDQGHLPGAIFVDVEHDVSTHGPATSGRHPWPTPDEFAAAMSRLGIGDDTIVIAYDDSGGVTAGRLVWMLRAIGHPAALLDGGIAAWPGPLSTEPTRRPAAPFTPVPWPADRLADADQTSRCAAAASGAVLDARAGDRFAGENEPIDPRAGHIPGAANVPARSVLDANGRFLTPEQLRRRFDEAGVDGARDVTVYCGSGVSACIVLLALEVAGFGDGRLYPPSWSGWSADPDRPVATGH